ncbi:right-handed parallel beta-helix repeat-containing protein [Caballeronia sp. Lep1P3]|uniref:right-handed parallel beta-helix repeat-containing protein n=1 Tax=Caballeronia sp. Lep1P3 TaxID=2878150 RepID=UPI001FD1D538|nr:right-handed parallel beta-helix repeat-containing protein [Caballeronia sp. Lep1P3]
MASTKTEIQQVLEVPSTMRRKLVSAFVLGAGSLALAACGGGNDGSVADAVANRQRRRSGAAAASSASSASSATAASAATTASSTAAASTNTGSQGTANTSTSGVLQDKSFGVKGDGTTNDRAALQAAIDGSVGQILLITGKSRIDATGLTLRSNTHIRFAQGASIKMLPHNTSTYQMMRVADVSNVNIEAPYLDGSKELNSAGSGEFGMGISITGATGVTITNPTTINCWGDGIYIGNSGGGSGKTSSNVSISGHHANGCRRQGATITSGNGITFTNPLWENISGTAPSCGLDIEPDDNSAVLQAIKIVSPTTQGCAGPGIQVYLGAFPGPVSKNVDIQITNHTDNCKIGPFGVGGLQLNGRVVTGAITSTNPVWKQNWYLGDWDSKGPKVSVVNPKIG